MNKLTTFKLIAKKQKKNGKTYTFDYIELPKIFIYKFEICSINNSH
jgi:hypothetical protein